MKFQQPHLRDRK